MVALQSCEMRLVNRIAQQLTGRPQQVFKAIAIECAKRHYDHGDDDDVGHHDDVDDPALYNHLPRAIWRHVREIIDPTDYLGLTTTRRRRRKSQQLSLILVRCQDPLCQLYRRRHARTITTSRLPTLLLLLFRNKRSRTRRGPRRQCRSIP
jgi:hypothetical protein